MSDRWHPAISQAAASKAAFEESPAGKAAVERAGVEKAAAAKKAADEKAAAFAKTAAAAEAAAEKTAAAEKAVERARAAKGAAEAAEMATTMHTWLRDEKGKICVDAEEHAAIVQAFENPRLKPETLIPEHPKPLTLNSQSSILNPQS